MSDSVLDICGLGNIVKGVKKRKKKCSPPVGPRTYPCSNADRWRSNESLHTLLSKLDIVEKKLGKFDQTHPSATQGMTSCTRVASCQSNPCSKLKVRLPDNWLGLMKNYETSGNRPCLEVSVKSETDYDCGEEQTGATWDRKSDHHQMVRCNVPEARPQRFGCAVIHQNDCRGGSSNAKQYTPVEENLDVMGHVTTNSRIHHEPKQDPGVCYDSKYRPNKKTSCNYDCCSSRNQEYGPGDFNSGHSSFLNSSYVTKCEDQQHPLPSCQILPTSSCCHDGSEASILYQLGFGHPPISSCGDQQSAKYCCRAASCCEEGTEHGIWNGPPPISLCGDQQPPYSNCGGSSTMPSCQDDSGQNITYGPYPSSLYVSRCRDHQLPSSTCRGIPPNGALPYSTRKYKLPRKPCSSPKNTREAPEKYNTLNASPNCLCAQAICMIQNCSKHTGQGQSDPRSQTGDNESSSRDISCSCCESQFRTLIVNTPRTPIVTSSHADIAEGVETKNDEPQKSGRVESDRIAPIKSCECDIKDTSRPSHSPQKYECRSSNKSPNSRKEEGKLEKQCSLSPSKDKSSHRPHSNVDSTIDVPSDDEEASHNPKSSPERHNHPRDENMRSSKDAVPELTSSQGSRISKDNASNSQKSSLQKRQRSHDENTNSTSDATQNTKRASLSSKLSLEKPDLPQNDDTSRDPTTDNKKASQSKSSPEKQDYGNRANYSASDKKGSLTPTNRSPHGRIDHSLYIKDDIEFEGQGESQFSFNPPGNNRMSDLKSAHTPLLASSRPMQRGFVPLPLPPRVAFPESKLNAAEECDAYSCSARLPSPHLKPDLLINEGIVITSHPSNIRTPTNQDYKGVYETVESSVSPSHIERTSSNNNVILPVHLPVPSHLGSKKSGRLNEKYLKELMLPFKHQGADHSKQENPAIQKNVQRFIVGRLIHINPNTREIAKTSQITNFAKAKEGMVIVKNNRPQAISLEFSYGSKPDMSGTSKCQTDMSGTSASQTDSSGKSTYQPDNYWKLACVPEISGTSTCQTDGKSVYDPASYLAEMSTDATCPYGIIGKSCCPPEISRTSTCQTKISGKSTCKPETSGTSNSKTDTNGKSICQPETSGKSAYLTEMSGTTSSQTKTVGTPTCEPDRYPNSTCEHRMSDTSNSQPPMSPKSSHQPEMCSTPTCQPDICETHACQTTIPMKSNCHPEILEKPTSQPEMGENCNLQLEHPVTSSGTNGTARSTTQRMNNREYEQFQEFLKASMLKLFYSPQRAAASSRDAMKHGVQNQDSSMIFDEDTKRINTETSKPSHTAPSSFDEQKRDNAQSFSDVAGGTVRYNYNSINDELKELIWNSHFNPSDTQDSNENVYVPTANSQLVTAQVSSDTRSDRNSHQKPYEGLQKASEIMDFLEIFPGQRRQGKVQEEKTRKWIAKIHKEQSDYDENIRGKVKKSKREYCQKISKARFFKKGGAIMKVDRHNKYHVPVQRVQSNSSVTNYDSSDDAEDTEQRYLVYMNESSLLSKERCKHGLSNRLPKLPTHWFRGTDRDGYTTIVQRIGNGSSDYSRPLIIENKPVRKHRLHHHYCHHKHRESSEESVKGKRNISRKKEIIVRKPVKQEVVERQRRDVRVPSRSPSDCSSSDCSIHNKRRFHKLQNSNEVKKTIYDHNRNNHKHALDEDYYDRKYEDRSTKTKRTSVDESEENNDQPLKSALKKSKLRSISSTSLRESDSSSSEYSSESSEASRRKRQSHNRPIKHAATHAARHLKVTHSPMSIKRIKVKKKNPNNFHTFRQRLITPDSKSSVGFEKVNVKDFIDFLATLSRNTISTLTNKKKALRLYRSYLTSPRRR